MRELRDMTPEEMAGYAVELGEKPFRGKQLFQWISKGAKDFGEMTNLPGAFRDRLSESAFVSNLEMETLQRSKDHTQKALFRLGDGNTVETVLMEYSYGVTICISSQVGCAMACSFCASGSNGLIRNLTAGEMLGQILELSREAREEISRIVVMGTGEPFANYRNLTKFISLAHQKEGMNLSLRNITVSTCGLVPEMKRFAAEFPQVNLAVSLHAPTDGIRSRMMPVNAKYPVDQVLAACREITAKTKRRITFEYALVEGVNDSRETMLLLASKLRGMLCHVNLIPMNPVMDSGLMGTSRKKAEELAALLEKNGIPATVRRELGGEIDGACGQLRIRSK